MTLTACGGGGSSSPTTPPAPTPPSIALSSTANQTLSGGKPVALSATVSSTDAVTWQLAAGAPGSLSASTGATVNYLPPASVTAITQVNITASAGGGSKSFSLTLYPEPGPAGLSRIAGSAGGFGLIDGKGTAARFAPITDMAGAADGSCYIAESSFDGRAAIRKVTAAGAVNTLAMSAHGHTDGANGQALLGSISAIADGGNGSILFIDSSGDNAYLRRLAADGQVRTLLQHPLLANAHALVAGAGDTAYVLRERSVVQVSVGTATVLAGLDNDTEYKVLDGQGANARFTPLTAMVRDRAGNLIVLQRWGGLRKVTPEGAVTTMTPVPAGAATTDYISLVLDKDDQPMALAVAADARLYAVQRMTSLGGVSLLQRAYTPAGYDRYTPPDHLCMIDGQVALADKGEIHLLQDGALRHLAGLGDDTSRDIDGPADIARFSSPELIAADQQENLYVSDYPAPSGIMGARLGGLYLRKIAASGQVSTVLTRESFGIPASMATDNAGNLYLTEWHPYASRIRPQGGAIYKMTPAGQLSLLAGQPVSAGTSDTQVDGPALTARFTAPLLIGVDAAGNLYLHDKAMGQASPAIRKMAPDGTMSTIAALPAGIGAAPDGHTYVVESPAIYRMTPDGGKQLVAGNPARNETALGPLPGSLYGVRAMTPTGPYSFAVISGNAILKLVLPH